MFTDFSSGEDILLPSVTTSSLHHDELWDRNINHLVEIADFEMEEPNLLDKLYNFPAKDILIPSLKVGALSGTTGLLFGSVAGLISSAHPALFTIGAGIQWSALGSTWWATRALILHNYYPDRSAKDRLKASTFAGGITGGAIGGLSRGPRNIIPGAIMFTLFGSLGQTIFNALDARHTKQVGIEIQAAAEGKTQGRKRFWERVAEMKWSPLTVVSDEDYGNLLKEKLLRVEAEIALVDEEMERLRGEERRMKERQDKEPPKPNT